MIDGMIWWLTGHAHFFVETAPVAQHKLVGVPVGKPVGCKFAVGVDGLVVDFQHNVSLSHAVLVGIALVPDEADGGLVVLIDKGHSELLLLTLMLSAPL